MHDWHEAHGVVPLAAGAWVRPDHYGDPAAEVRAVRERVGIIDVTPIGKRRSSVPVTGSRRWPRCAPVVPGPRSSAG
jgi:glycine cleavage system aminomethyltransferase T